MPTYYAVARSDAGGTKGNGSAACALRVPSGDEGQAPLVGHDCKCIFSNKLWCRGAESNCRHHDFQPRANAALKRPRRDSTNAF